jgi:DNA-directed RNA polymerase specialized sigma24 family protein
MSAGRSNVAGRGARCCATADTERGLERVLAAVEPALRSAARRLTGNRDLREDLVQEARIYLWRMDPARFDLSDGEELRYVRRELLARMWRVWRAEMRRGLG